MGGLVPKQSRKKARPLSHGHLSGAVDEHDAAVKNTYLVLKQKNRERLEREVVALVLKN